MGTMGRLIIKINKFLNISNKDFKLKITLKRTLLCTFCTPSVNFKMLFLKNLQSVEKIF